MGIFIPTIVKMLSPKILTLIMDYVFKENELDRKVKILEDKVSKLENKQEKIMTTYNDGIRKKKMGKKKKTKKIKKTNRRK